MSSFSWLWGSSWGRGALNTQPFFSCHITVGGAQSCPQNHLSISFHSCYLITQMPYWTWNFFLQEACTLPDCIRQIRKWYILFWNPYSLSGVAIRDSIIPFISNHSWKLGPFSGTESIPVNLPFLPSLIKLCSHFVNSSAVIVFLTPAYGTYTVGFSLFVSGCPWVCNMCL